MRSLVGQPALGWGEAPSFGGPFLFQDRLQQVSAQIPPVSKEVEIWAVSSPFSAGCEYYSPGNGPSLLLNIIER